MNSSTISTGNIVNVSWGDHLVFGEGDGKLDTPEAISRRIERWKTDLGAKAILWREKRSVIRGHYFAAKGFTTKQFRRTVDWDDFKVVPELCHKSGVGAYLYVTLFDEGWPLPSKRQREISYHNSMHAQHWSRQSRFTRKHPEFLVCDRKGSRRHWGVPCLAYPEVRQHYCERYLELLDGYEFDGLFLCLRSQSKPAEFADQYGFNEPIRQEYRKRYGVDIQKEDFDLASWRDLVGEGLTQLISEIRKGLNQRGLRLTIGVPRGDVIGPPLGNWTLHWREWVRKRLIDGLIVNQSSSQCPSMWHDLWPMHRGYGYTESYIDGRGMSALRNQLTDEYGPVFSDSKADLYIARQWDERSETEEREFGSLPGVSGLVFSSFRYDNQAAVGKGDWRA